MLSYHFQNQNPNATTTEVLSITSITGIPAIINIATTTTKAAHCLYIVYKLYKAKEIYFSFITSSGYLYTYNLYIRLCILFI